MSIAGTIRETAERAHSVAESFRGDRPLKVVFVIDNMRYGGTELNAVRTAERLDSARVAIRVFCLSGEGPLAERYRMKGIPVEHVQIGSLYGPSMISAGWKFMRYLRRERVDIVHAHDVYSNIFATLWARLARVPVVIVSRRWWHSLPNGKLRLGNRLAFPLANAVLANSVQVARTVRAEGIAAKKVWTVPNFADDEAFVVPSVEEWGQLRQDWRMPEQAVVIGCVARLDPVKDHATLLRAFAIVRQNYPQAYLLLIGDGPTRAELEVLIDELKVRDALRMTGEVRNGRNHHRGIDISVLASTSEGFPNSIVEAMAVGNPVVATAVGGTVDAVLHEETGFLVPPGDPVALARALERLVSSEALRRRLGTAGRNRAMDYFRASTVLQMLQEMYEELRAAAVV